MADFIGTGLSGTPQLEVDGPSYVTQEDRSTVTLPSPNASGGSGGYSYSWSWSSRPTGATATFSDDTAEQPTVTPDAEGEWIAECTVTDSDGTEIEFVAATGIGMEIAAGVWAQVLVHTDYTAAVNQDISGGGAVTIDGVGANSSVAGTPDTWAVEHGTGLRMLETSGAGIHSGRLAYDLAALGVVAGDTVIMEVDAVPDSMNANNDRIYVALTQSDTGLGTDYSQVVLRRIGAADYAWFARASVAGLFNDGQLDTVLPSHWRAAIVAGDRQSDARCDIAAGGLGDRPGEIAFRSGLRNTDNRSNNKDVGDRFASTTANLYASIIAVAHAGDADLIFREIRISRVPARGAQ